MPLNPGAGGVKVNAARGPMGKTYDIINRQSGSLPFVLAENDDTGQRSQQSKKRVTIQKKVNNLPSGFYFAGGNTLQLQQSPR
jgi:D-lyxose ketol-isomerase